MLAHIKSEYVSGLTERELGKPVKREVAFLLCKSCFWCASILVAGSNDRCPACGGALFRKQLKLQVRNYDR
jgi:hypothetical protein